MRISNWIFTVFATLTPLALTASDLTSAAHNFIDANDRLVRTRTEVADDRTQMSNDLADQEHLERDVQEWFGDRSDISEFSLDKARQRGNMLEAAGTTFPAVQKPLKATGNLQQDAQSFINHYDAWVSLNNAVNLDTEHIRTALNTDNRQALQDAVNAFFTDRRARESNRRQWNSDLKSLIKILHFKGTAKAGKPPGNSLKDHTAEFLSDRAEWVTTGTQIQGDLNNIRGTVGSDSLEASVRSLLVDRNLRATKEKELSVDRKAMRARNGLKSVGSTLKELVVKSAPKEGDVDEEEPELEQSPNFLVGPAT